MELLLDEEFPHLRGQTYLDHAGATVYSKTQISQVQELLLSRLHCNPHTRVEDGREVDEVRDLVLSHFSTSSEEYR